MLYSNDIELVEKAVDKGFRDQDSSNAWSRIKKFIGEAQKTSNNSDYTASLEAELNISFSEESLDVSDEFISKLATRLNSAVKTLQNCA